MYTRATNSYNVVYRSTRTAVRTRRPFCRMPFLTRRTNHNTQTPRRRCRVPPLAFASRLQNISSIGEEGGCEEVCNVLQRCAEFGGACPRIQSWALGCVANLLVCSENRRRFISKAGDGEATAENGLDGWIHTLLANSDRVANDRQVFRRTW